MIHSRKEHLDILDLKNFRVETLVIESDKLKKNPLRDSHIRRNPVLIPKTKTIKGDLPVILILAGFTGNGPKYFSIKSFEENVPQVLDRCFSAGQAPEALYVFVDAWTYWGGSQFINSKGTGLYEDYIIKELVPAIKKSYEVENQSQFWCVMGGSSGGYGALHLASRYPEVFSLSAATAPDSFFSLSLLPEVYAAYPSLTQFGGARGIKKEIEAGRFLRRRDAHTVLNVIGMGFCYAPKISQKGEIEWPINQQGKLIASKWDRWKKYDPIEFLPKRVKQLKDLKKIYLDVGNRDQYHLQFGARQIADFLKKNNIPHNYAEFNGSHFDIGERRPYVWQWLKNIWSR